MTEELTQAVESGRLDAKTAESLSRLAPGAFCQHKSWGFGRVAEWNLLAGQIFIDFGAKKRHPMQAVYAAETLAPIPENHILARKATDPATVKVEAVDEPVSLARRILADFGGRATPEQIIASLQPEVFDAAGAKKWWESTKKKLKADGHFQLPAKKNEAVVLLESPVSPGQGLIEQFRVARHAKDQIIALDQITKALDDLANEVTELQSLAAHIEDTAQKGRKLQPAAAVEMLIARDEIVGRHAALQLSPEAPSVADLLIAEESRLAALFAGLPASKHRRVLESFEKAFGDRWTDKALRLAQESPARLVVEIFKAFEKARKLDVLNQALARWISDRSISSEVLIWLLRERGAAFPDLFNAELLAAVFSSLERDQLAEKRGSRLQDLLIDDRELLGELIEGADRDTVRDIMRKLRLTPVFDDLSKRSLMARIVKLHPETQNLITGDAPEERAELLTVSWPSLEKRKADYEYLVQKEIPQNLRDINVAREQGDLRENFGFKAAKEQQRVLQRRKIEAERDLATARGTDFENPDTTQVSIGTVVTLQTPTGPEKYSILGAWDSAPELGIVSYKAAIGQSLLGRKPGESVELPTESGTPRIATIASIVAFTDHDVLREKVHIIRPLEDATPQIPLSSE
ncbi:MAG: GreA/GreB family elongation factor [Terrimicrobiaceae bacterium]|nr:GreA/GreB family elongation factor [Terrimicrobiaceae bacterium]